MSIEPGNKGGGVPKLIVALLLGVAVVTFVLGLIKGQSEKEFTRAVQTYQSGKYADAIAALDQIILRDVKNVDAYLLRCRAYYQLHDNRHAKEDCTRAIDLAPDNENAYYYRGLVLVELDKPEQAADDFRRVLEFNPDHPYASDLKEFIGQYGPPGA